MTATPKTPEVRNHRDRAAEARESRRLRETGFRRKALGLAAFVILAATVLNALFGEAGILGLLRAQKEYEALALEVDTLRSENDRLSREIGALRHDPLVIERMAREVLGMAKPDEIVVTVRDGGG